MYVYMFLTSLRSNPVTAEEIRPLMSPITAVSDLRNP
jgi:hypothetical protein